MQPFSRECVTKVEARSEQLQITKVLRIRNTMFTVLDQIANTIYKETNAGTKPGCTIDLFQLICKSNPGS
jgi:hypothetical protein